MVAVRGRSWALFVTLGILALGLFAADIALGAVNLPLRQVLQALTGDTECPRQVAKIVLDIRLVKALVAVMAGAGLAVSGLMMQTLFRNPLAGPYVLGISSGASLGVAMFMLTPAVVAGTLISSFGIAGAAWIGSAVVLTAVAVVGRRVKDIMVVLILGMMFASGVGAVVQVLQYLSHDESLKAFIIWTMGSLGDVTSLQLWVMVPSAVIGLALAWVAVKPLNLLLLGEEYARTMGLKVSHARGLLFLSTTLLAGTVTAFCGPIGFIGLALPHVARVAWAEADHRILVPATALVGAVTLLGCDIVSKALTLPINAITALLGIPIVVWIVMRNKAMTT